MHSTGDRITSYNVCYTKLLRATPAKGYKFSASHAKDAKFESGLRDCFEYRDLGIAEATGGRAMAHVVRAREGVKSGFGWHKHILDS